MSAPAKFKTYPLLQPLAWIYGQIMQWRNERFDSGRLPVRSFDVPVISVGNIAVGGTGKTPMSIYLLNLLCANGLQPALLSRGYGRKTKGYRMVTAQTTAAEVGDEPLEVFKALDGNVSVSVCEDRCAGADLLLQEKKEIGAIVLDDAYQHRYIGRNLNILLTDYNRLYIRDSVMPAGRLRERRQGAQRADIVVVTKSPADLSTAEAEQLKAELHLNESQPLFFTSIGYGLCPIEDLASKRVLLVTGIAKPQPLIEYYKGLCDEVETLTFPDHHAFSDSDISRIEQRAAKADVVVTTSKDFQRLQPMLTAQLQTKMVVQQISVKFLFDQGAQFDSLIMGAVNNFKK